ncbi:prolipoprotein diacylglyceryl transferase [Rivibacter subsaxonicus]|uniref:Phosphatidylglycerol--prolipoprotein diacylglyceryl transferase n=1 Tax=Rivibacter subsaxonicus TaxID=457575 RepID=A0A4Q7VCQ3_9BURK|nr:prolipoprotein diacylglyceryl transferase [Rivibacter subsaxonicus]RZT93657.1 prolipoprotein diacylglyceryl transferase [Rivibacter subsaxonicus]
MLTHPQYNPIAIDLHSIGIPFGVHWYGLMYLVAFVLFLLLARLRVSRPPYVELGWTPRDIEDLLFYGVLGVILGGRLGYVIFYKPAHFLAHPLEIFAVWQGGMAFHGGLLGVIAALWLFGRTRKRPFLEVADVVAPCAPLGLAAGRMGNFINGELWGRAADPALPWAMVFPQARDGIARHPSQLYQFALEGVLLFALLWWYGRKPRATGRVAALFMIGYGCLRFTAEWFREPDSFLGLLGLGLSMGQWLSLPMVAIGLWVWFRAGRNSTGTVRTRTA